MELCSTGDLLEFILANGDYNKDTKLVKQLQYQLCTGLKAIHTKSNHAHLDLKPENILIGDDGFLKITDFGFALPVEEETKQKTGTQSYQAPEIDFRDLKAYNVVKADIFNLGLVFFILK